MHLKVNQIMNILSNLFTEMAMEEGEGQGESADVQGDEPGPSAPSGEGQNPYL